MQYNMDLRALGITSTIDKIIQELNEIILVYHTGNEKIELEIKQIFGYRGAI